MVFKLTAKDKQLISELEQDSRQSITQIAKKIGVAKAVANYRLKRLIDHKFITSFDLLVDYHAIKKKLYLFQINLHNLEKNTRKEILNYLREKNIETKLFLQGSWDLELYLWVKEPKEFYSFYDGFIEKYAEFIANKEFSIIKTIYYLGNSHITANKKEVVLEGKKDYEDDLDKEEIDLLNLLEKNPRATLVELSATLKTAVSTLQYRMKKLSSTIMKRAIPLLDTSLIGYNRFKVNLLLNNTSKINSIIEKLRQKPNVTLIFDIIGKTDLSFEADFKTTQELDKFLEDLRISTPYISDFEVISVIRNN